MKLKIAVLNGSPKADNSVTMQYVYYLQQIFSQHEFKILHVTQSLPKLEKDPTYFQEIIAEVERADAVLWAFPLYILLVPADYKRFIELLWERNATGAFAGKYTAAFSTSIHYFDHTAHKYIHAVCDDLEMKYIDYYSADMNDLLKAEERAKLVLFMEYFLEAVENKIPVNRVYPPLRHKSTVYTPGQIKEPIDNAGKKVLIISDATGDGSNLGRMVKRLSSVFGAPPTVIDLNHLEMKGGCLGCNHCGFDHQCVYDNQDQIREVYETDIHKADIVIFAGSIADRYLSARWKTFIDRRFYNQHQPILPGKQLAYLISGPLGQTANLREILVTLAELDHANLVGFVTDESGDSTLIDSLLDDLARRLVHCAVENFQKPATFRGVAGAKLIRDEVWGRLRFALQGDHRHHKKHRLYNFPQKDLKSRIKNNILILISKLPPAKRMMKAKQTEIMVMPYKKVVFEAVKKD